MSNTRRLARPRRSAEEEERVMAETLAFLAAGGQIARADGSVARITEDGRQQYERHLAEMNAARALPPAPDA